MNEEHGIERRNTDWGFLLIVPTVDGYDLEFYGMAGIGRYEMFNSCLIEHYSEIAKTVKEVETERRSDVVIYQTTKQKLIL